MSTTHHETPSGDSYTDWETLRAELRADISPEELARAKAELDEYLSTYSESEPMTDLNWYYTCVFKGDIDNDVATSLHIEQSASVHIDGDAKTVEFNGYFGADGDHSVDVLGKKIRAVVEASPNLVFLSCKLVDADLHGTKIRKELGISDEMSDEEYLDKLFTDKTKEADAK